MAVLCTAVVGSWLLVLGSWSETPLNQQPRTESQEPASIDVVPIAPYNETNQEFGESRWTLN
jgi:hypothetical protein